MSNTHRSALLEAGRVYFQALCSSGCFSNVYIKEEVDLLRALHLHQRVVLGVAVNEGNWKSLQRLRSSELVSLLQGKSIPIHLDLSAEDDTEYLDALVNRIKGLLWPQFDSKSERRSLH